MDITNEIETLIQTNAKTEQVKEIHEKIETKQIEKQIAIDLQNKTIPDIEIHRNRIAAAIAGGNSQYYFGKIILDADKLSIKDVEKYYAKYDQKLGADMTKSLGRTAIEMYSRIFSMFIPIDSTENLNNDLEKDPIISTTLNTISSQLYHTFGNFLAPVAISAITVKHIEFPPQPQPQEVVIVEPEAEEKNNIITI